MSIRNRLITTRRAVARGLQRTIRTDIPTERILIGQQVGSRTTNQWAADMGNPRLASLPVRDWPHVRFLKDYERLGDAVFEDDFFYSSAYFKNAWDCINVYHYFTWCRRREEVKEAAKWFARCYEQGAWLHGDGGRQVQAVDGASSPGHPVIVRPVRDSDCYQACDGHHRMAAAYARGEEAIRGHINFWPKVHTAVQLLLLDVDRHRGQRKCLQPVDECAEVKFWPVVRSCEDQLRSMEEFLDRAGLRDRPGANMLDVECGFGWFVRAFSGWGYRALGWESDRSCCEIGRHVYELHGDQFVRGNLAELLRGEEAKADVVLCLGALGDYLRGIRALDAGELLGHLDRRTRQVLFVDLPRAQELGSGAGPWSQDSFAAWMKKNSSFRQVVPLDSAEPTLFACVRS